MDTTVETLKEEYLQMIYDEMALRGYTKSEADCIISKTGFLQSLNEYPMESLRISAESAVDEIMFVALKRCL